LLYRAEWSQPGKIPEESEKDGVMGREQRSFATCLTTLGLHNANLRILNFRDLQRGMRKHALARKPAAAWIEAVEPAEWDSIVDARQSCPQADFITGTQYTCFNIGSNFRLITTVSYELQEILIKELTTHRVQ
jgi:mRNA-degrading endonuclease HigB of HigAB toxin-antitoxin module